MTAPVLSYILAVDDSNYEPPALPWGDLYHTVTRWAVSSMRTGPASVGTTMRRLVDVLPSSFLPADMPSY